MRKLVVTLILLSLLTISAIPVLAQQTGFIHTVQYGETLGSIAIRYNVPINALIAANNLFNPQLYLCRAKYIYTEWCCYRRSNDKLPGCNACNPDTNQHLYCAAGRQFNRNC